MGVMHLDASLTDPNIWCARKLVKFGVRCAMRSVSPKYVADPRQVTAILVISLRQQMKGDEGTGISPAVIHPLWWPQSCPLTGVGCRNSICRATTASVITAVCAVLLSQPLPRTPVDP